MTEVILRPVFRECYLVCEIQSTQFYYGAFIARVKFSQSFLPKYNNYTHVENYLVYVLSCIHVFRRNVELESYNF